MRRIWVSVQSPFETGMVDLELPGEKPIQALLPNLIQAMNWPETRDGEKLYYALAAEDGRPIDPQETLTSAGLRQQSIVTILVGERPFLPSRSGPLLERPAPAATSGRGRAATDAGPEAGGTRAQVESPATGRPGVFPPGWKKLDDAEV